MFDIWLVGLPLAIAVAIGWALVSPAFAAWAQKSYAVAVFGWVVWPFAMLVEALLFAIFRQTPGKALLGVRVTTTAGKKLAARDYLLRLCSVFCFGMFTGIPILTLFAMFRQRRWLQREKTASYDAGHYAVRAGRMGILRWVAVVALFLVFLVINGVLVLASPGRY